MKEYEDFLKNKTHSQDKFGLDPIFMPDFLFDFQKSCVNWSLIMGRSALFTVQVKTMKKIIENIKSIIFWLKQWWV